MWVLSFCLGVVFLILFMISYKIKEYWYRSTLKERRMWFKLFWHDTEELWCTLMIVCLASFILIGMIAGLEYKPRIEEKIIIYEQENEQIEERMATLVEEYMAFELGVVKECSPKKAASLVNLYPNLASSTLVSKQMETYTQNLHEIKLLKSQQLTQSIVRWWLYFGD